MSGNWGKKIKYTIFGESHGDAVGIVIDGLKPGLKLDMENVNFEMKRRAPGNSKITTSRRETDSVEILSGYFNGFTTGTPLCAIIHNNNSNSRDYDKLKDVMRPGHADFTGYVKYNGFNDYRGGGHFSGRITAPLVFAGAIAKQILKEKNILVGSHIYSIAHLTDTSFDLTNITEEQLKVLLSSDFPVIDYEKSADMKEIIIEAKEAGDSVGGIIEACAINVPCGIGDPFFDSIESVISHLIFSVPSVKGIEFGLGFDITKIKGSQANDEMYVDSGNVKFYSNNNGGINGGITNGMPITLKVAIKPTPSISKPQKSINIASMEDTQISVAGRHDPCIVIRAVPVVEACISVALLEFMS